MTDPMIGLEVDGGEYRIIERIGTGGMGSVYKAEQPSMNRKVAIKILHARYLSRDDLVSRFRREARAMSQLSHPNTARVYKYGQLDDGSFYFVMEYMMGRNLAQHVRMNGPMEAEQAINIMIQVCGALEEAHQAGIIHRDLKPENIFLTDQGGTQRFPKVLDFGLAKVSEAQMGRMSIMNLTQQGTVFGTPEFMSPEQALGEPLDNRTDIYSLGLILYELVTGKLPFDVKGKREMMTAQVQSPPIPVSKRVPGLRFPPGLDQVMEKALAKSPDDRYTSAIEFAKALKTCLRGDMSTAAKWAVPREVLERANAHSALLEEDPPQLPVSKTPYIVLGIGVLLFILGIGALIVSVTSN